MPELQPLDDFGGPVVDLGAGFQRIPMEPWEPKVMREHLAEQIEGYMPDNGISTYVRYLHFFVLSQKESKYI